MDSGLSDYLRWFATDHQRDLASGALKQAQTRFSVETQADYFAEVWLTEWKRLSGRPTPTAQQVDVLHQLADVLVDVAAQSPTSIAGGLLVAARALEEYTERCVRG